ncbi:MAG: hypothetical protein GYA55_06395, partial [SAR324 cluster bacterium]|nr:hypothetical protein [SAR324 cluster bacterium]
AKGGDYPFWRLFSNNFFLYLGESAKSVGGNECETSSFIFLFPYIIASLFWNLGARPQKLDPIYSRLILYLFFAVYYMVVGIPEWFSRSSFLYVMPGYRSKPGIGLAGTVLLAKFFGDVNISSSKTKMIALTALSIIGASFVLREIQASYPSIPLWNSVLGIIFAGICGIAFSRTDFARWFLIPLCILHFSTTAFFNPLVIGGSDYIRNNKLSKLIIEVDNNSNK